MTKEQKIADIRAKCIEANPTITALPRFPEDSATRKAIVELSRFVGLTQNNPDLTVTASIYLRHYEQEKVGAYIRELEGKYPSRRPICLADVMRAIDNMMIVVDCNGNFYRMEMKLSDKMPKIESHLGAWALPLTLEDQPDETIDFIHDILNTTK